ncbi:AAA_31 domain-containing protein [Trichonephila clavipes]|nr:AAA_31 domain-containing protein [Trichonephila clavipes]
MFKSWYARRQDAGLPSFTFVEAYGDLRKELTELNKRYDIVLVDTAGHDSQEFRSALTVSDILLAGKAVLAIGDRLYRSPHGNRQNGAGKAQPFVESAPGL